MERFRKYLDRSIDPAAVRNAALCESLGIEQRYVPEDLGVFEELVFGLGDRWSEQKVVFVTILEQSRLKRISLGRVPEGGDDDDLVAFTAGELAALLAEKGETLARFLDRVFPSCAPPIDVDDREDGAGGTQGGGTPAT